MDDIDLARMYVSKHSSCRDRGIPFELTLTQFKRLKERKICAYTGLRFTDDKQLSSTLERIDNTRGYTRENTVAVCYCINNLKGLMENPENPLDLRITLKAFTKIALILG